MVGAAEGFGGRLMRTVSFLGCTLPVSFFGGTAPVGMLGTLSAINHGSRYVALTTCQILFLNRTKGRVNA
jgi:hypothetical protein